MINEMITTNTGHAVICTQEQYAMLRLTDTLQLEISPVYATRGSPTQATDAAMLVLFYAHAALGAGKRYTDAPATGITAMRSPSRFPNLGIAAARGRTLVAKTAHGPSATQRLVCEYNAYAAMRTLQGTAIPKAHTLPPASPSAQVGVQHNDLEPRNVTQSSSGPLIIDFDRASLDHNCPGALCKELQQVAQALDLNPVTEMETLAEETATPPTVYSIVVAFISAVSALFGFPRRPRSANAGILVE
ncbi:hypothetical protein B0H13DRAFT_2267044 [Mycena leptocephala]|nr:hypothetical protein B0H13DRAFT_2267044 [Mycena leptocephala]